MKKTNFFSWTFRRHFQRAKNIKVQTNWKEFIFFLRFGRRKGRWRKGRRRRNKFGKVTWWFINRYFSYGFYRFFLVFAVLHLRLLKRFSFFVLFSCDSFLFVPFFLATSHFTPKSYWKSILIFNSGKKDSRSRSNSKERRLKEEGERDWRKRGRKK